MTSLKDTEETFYSATQINA